MTASVIAQVVMVLTLLLMITGKTPIYMTAIVGATLSALIAGFPIMGSTEMTIAKMVNTGLNPVIADMTGILLFIGIMQATGFLDVIIRDIVRVGNKLGGGTGEQCLNINASGGEGEQADGAEDGVATADIIRDNEALVAFGDRFVVKSAMSGIGGGVDARLGGITVFGVKFSFEKAEGHGWFGGGAGFRDDVDGEVVVAEGGEEVGVGFGAERVAGVKQFHARSGAEGFGEGAVAEIGATDTDTNEIFGVLLDFGGGCLDSGKLSAVVGLR